MKYCPNCGSELTEGAKFCPACGYMISDYTAAANPLPEKEIFPDPADKRKGAFGFEAESGKEKKAKYDPFSDEAPKYSDYTDSDTRFADERSSSDYGTDYSSEREGSSETNGFAIASLVTGIIALLFNALLFIPSILAVIFGIVGLKRSEETGCGRGMSITGIVLGIVAFSIYLILIICAVAFTGVLISL